MPDGYPVQPEIWASCLTPRWKFAIELAHGDIRETRVDFSGLARQLSRSDPAAILPAIGPVDSGNDAAGGNTRQLFGPGRAGTRSASAVGGVDVDGTRVSMVAS